MRRRLPSALAIVLLPAALAVGAFVAVQTLRPDDDLTVRPSLSGLAAKNYRVLTAAQSRTLLRYAEAVHRCLVAHGSKVAGPVASSTRITMRAPNQSATALVHSMLACDATVGAPPADASLQARPGVVLLFLPKQCLLDPTELDTAQDRAGTGA
jgi:hypothetical protein